MNEQTNPEVFENEEPPPEGSAQPVEAVEAVTGAEAPAQLPAAPGDAPSLDVNVVKRVLEAALLSTPEPLSMQQLKRLFAGEVDAESLRKLLNELREEWSERSVELTAVASGWRFRVKPDYQKFLDRISNEKPPRYSRAVLETLAIIAYRQPVTRGDIEEVRGVAVSPPTLKALEERGWIEIVGHRETPGRPALFATTRRFLDDLNLRSLEELPPLDELQSALESSPAAAPVQQALEPAAQPLLGDPPEPPPSTPESPSHEG